MFLALHIYPSNAPPLAQSGSILKERRLFTQIYLDVAPRGLQALAVALERTTRSFEAARMGIPGIWPGTWAVDEGGAGTCVAGYSSGEPAFYFDVGAIACTIIRVYLPRRPLLAHGPSVTLRKLTRHVRDCRPAGRVCACECGWVGGRGAGRQGSLSLRVASLSAGESDKKVIWDRNRRCARTRRKGANLMLCKF